MRSIEYSSVESQIEHLKLQNLIISNEAFAKEQLMLFGYSNLIKNYRDPYTIIANGSRLFRNDVTFEQIHSLYLLDKNLRNAVMAAMLDFEEYIKEAAADVIALSFGTNEKDYLSFRNYRNKRKRVKRFTLTSILNTMRETLETDKDPISHYSLVHGMVPPWILYKSIYLGTMVNYIDQFKTREQIMLSEKLYNNDALGLSEKAAIQLMMDTLFTCMNYRNRAAHGGRIYDYESSNTIHQDAGQRNYAQGFSKLLFVLNCLNYQMPFLHLYNNLNNQLNRHCKQYPSDVTYLSQILRIDIAQKVFVYKSSSSNKYHADSHCSGIRNAERVELSEAKATGLIPCKRCYPATLK